MIELELVDTGLAVVNDKVQSLKLKRLQAKLTAKQIFEWGIEDCPHKHQLRSSTGRILQEFSGGEKKRECPLCWQELQEK